MDALMILQLLLLILQLLLLLLLHLPALNHLLNAPWMNAFQQVVMTVLVTLGFVANTVAAARVVLTAKLLMVFRLQGVRKDRLE